MGWGELFGKFANYVQNREERRRNNLDVLSKKIGDLQGKNPFTSEDARALARLVMEHSRLLQNAKNA